MRRFNSKFVRTARRIIEGSRHLSPPEVFTAVLRRYRQIQTEDLARHQSRVLRDREFVADVELTARRILSPPQYTIFRLLYVWDRSPEFIVAHSIGYAAVLDVLLVKDRIELLLGRAFEETKPYPLYPLKEYFRDPELKEATKL